MLEADITGYIANGEWDLVGKRVGGLYRIDFQKCITSVVIAPHQ